MPPHLAEVAMKLIIIFTIFILSLIAFDDLKLGAPRASTPNEPKVNK